MIIILRVISGLAKGLRLKTLEGDATRPTSDRVKESVFNIIASIIPDAEVLDLFSGTGNLGIEALSRGAKTAVFVDRNPECTAIIKDNVKHANLNEGANIITGNVTEVLAGNISKNKFDIVFMDPPYSKNFVEETMDFISKTDIIKTNGIIIVEHSICDIVSEKFGDLRRIDSRKYGKTMISFYRKDMIV